MLKKWICIPVILYPLIVCGQNSDSLMQAGLETIQQKAEYLEGADEAGIDINELTSELTYFLEHPLNLNTADKQKLRQLGLLTDNQVKNLIDYRKKYGIFYSIYEIRIVDGFGRNTIEKIMPFVCVEPVQAKASDMKYLIRGKHEMMLRFQRRLVNSAGFNIPADSLQESKSGSFFLGDPNQIYLRYRYKVRDKLQVGFLAEKDAGEIFIRPRSEISSKIYDQIQGQSGFDFYSFHLSLEHIKFIKKLVVGDFHARYGQGLVLWSGLAFNGGIEPAGIKRYASGLSPNTSVNEGLFMRGAGIQLEWNSFEISSFYSRKKRDANIVIQEDGSPVASSFPSGGYHRSLNELFDKNQVMEQNFGGHIEFSRSRYQLGISVCKTIFSLAYHPDDKPYQLYKFRGKENLSGGINFDILFKRTNLFGELGFSANGGWALLGRSHAQCCQWKHFCDRLQGVPKTIPEYAGTGKWQTKWKCK